MEFKAIVIPSGNATGVEVPDHVVKSLGSDSRPLISITINGHTWRSRLARMRGQLLIGISAENRQASGISEGDLVVVNVELDTDPREVAEPTDIANALNRVPEARVAFDQLPFGLKRRQVKLIEEAKSPETRQRRIEKLVKEMASGKA